jgi:hypothetical protein
MDVKKITTRLKRHMGWRRLNPNQGDQIGQNFAYCPIVYFFKLHT